jgi:hypothetical protein
MNPNNLIELTEREEAIAQRAADLAVQRMTTEFYASVGKTVVNRLLIIIGAAVVAFLAGKGWLSK